MAIAEKGGIRIPIITYYSDKGVKAASKGLIGLETAANKLAKTFGVTLGVTALTAFGKKSLEVFAHEQKAMNQLTNTLYNLGLAYDAINADTFLNTLQDATGVAKDKLAPALQTLTTYTLNYAKAQELLKTALNVSAGSGLDVQTVSEALATAYSGNYKGLVALKVGITAAEAKTESFAQIMEQLNGTFKDAALIDNYQTRLAKLKVAATDAMSYIGQGISEALNTLTAGGDVSKAMETLRNFGKVLSEEIAGFATGIKQLFKDISEIPIVKVILMGIGGAIKGIDKLLGISKAAKADIANFDKKMALAKAKDNTKAIAAAKQQAALNKKLQAQQLADQKKATAEKAKQVALDKASLVLKQAASIFDMDQIEIVAAMMGRQTAEDYARLKLKKDLLDLQAALDAGDVETATRLATIVGEDYKRVAAYQSINMEAAIQAGLLQSIKSLTNGIQTNKNLINTDNLKDALAYIQELINKLGSLKVPTFGTGSGGTAANGSIGIGGTTAYQGVISSVGGLRNTPPLGDTPLEKYTNSLNEANSLLAQVGRDLAPLVNSGFFDNYYNTQEFLGQSVNTMAMTAAQGQAYSQSQITVNVAGSVTTQQDLVSAIIDGIQQSTASGIKTTVNRLNPEYL